MYARVTTFYLKREKYDLAIETYNSSVIPEAKMQSGFKGASFLVNKNAGKFISITIWETQENAIENQRSGYYKRQVDKFSLFQVVPPETEGYEVAVIDYGL